MTFVCNKPKIKLKKKTWEKPWKTGIKPQKICPQVSGYYDTRGSYFGFDEECDEDGFETGICPNDI